MASTQKKGCNGGWSGVVTFKKTLKDSLESDEPGIRKNTDRIKHKASRDYDYTARAVVDGTDPKNVVVNTKINFTDNDLNWGEERVFDTCHSTENGHWFIIENTDDRKTEAQASGSAESFDLQVNEMAGNYSFSASFPEVDGTYNREEHQKRSGHCQPKNNEPYDRSTSEATKVERSGFSIDSEKIDPKNLNVLSGTKIWGDDGNGAVRTFVFQVSWKFTRCPASILVTDVKFEDMKFPEWNAWKEVSEYESTIDGNEIKIKASVLNMTGEPKFVQVRFFETYKGDKYDGAKPDRALQGTSDSAPMVKLDPGEEREVEIPWHSEGYAWYEDGRPRPVQRFRAEAWESDALKDSLVENLRIAPKPLILVPGVWSSPKGFETWQNYLTESHSFGWRTYIAGGMSGQKNSVYDNADELAKFVRESQIKSNAWHVEMVGHSTGGLIARVFVHKQEIPPDNRPTVKHLMLLGTPNKGITCEEVLYNEENVMKANMQTAKELLPENIALFNQFVINRQGTRFSGLIGKSLPSLCPGNERNDGFVLVESAKYGLTDFALTKDLHRDLTSSENFWNFVKPHVVTGPNGKHPLSLKSEEGGFDGRDAPGN